MKAAMNQEIANVMIPLLFKIMEWSAKVSKLELVQLNVDQDKKCTAIKLKAVIKISSAPVMMKNVFKNKVQFVLNKPRKESVESNVEAIMKETVN